MTSSNLNYNITISLQYFDDVKISLKNVKNQYNNITFYISNGGLLFSIESCESAATNKISKTFLWGSLSKVSCFTDFEVCLMDKLK